MLVKTALMLLAGPRLAPIPLREPDVDFTSSASTECSSPHRALACFNFPARKQGKPIHFPGVHYGGLKLTLTDVFPNPLMKATRSTGC